MGVAYKEAGGGGKGGWASRNRVLSTIKLQTVVLCSQKTTGMHTNHRIGQDGDWQQLDA